MSTDNPVVEPVETPLSLVPVDTTGLAARSPSQGPREPISSQTCSVVRKRPLIEPGGCASIPRWVGTPPR